MTIQCLRLYLTEADHPRAACGFRPYFVLSEGRRWAELVSAETAEKIKVDVRLLKTGKPITIKPSRAARRLRAVARDYGLDGSKPIKETLRLLRG